MKVSDSLVKLISNIFFGLVILLSTFTVIKLRACLKKLNNCEIQNTETVDLLTTSMERERVLSFINFQIIDNIIVESEEGYNSPLDKLVTPPIIIFYLDPKRTCSPCVDNTIHALNLLGEKIGYPKIVLVTKYPSLRDLKLLKMKSDIRFPVFNTHDHLIKVLDDSRLSQTQVTFILDENHRLQLPNFSSYTDSVSNDYYNKLIRYFTLNN